MLRVIDRYVGRSFVFGYVVCLAALAGIFIIVDSFANFDEWIETGGSIPDMIGRLVQYYVFSLPRIFGFVAPFVTLLAGMFAVTSLNRFNELTPLKACGESIYRTVWPIFFLALASGGVAAVNQEILRPHAEARLKGLSAGVAVPQTGLIEQFKLADPDCPGLQLRGGEYNVAEKRITNVILKRSGPEGFTHITADFAVYKGSDDSGLWRLYGNVKEQRTWPNGMPIREIGHEEYVVQKLDATQPGAPFQIHSNITPDDIEVLHNPRLMATAPTVTLARLARRHPHDRRICTELQARFAAPLAGVVLLLLGLPFVLHSSARVFVIGLGACLFICAGFIFVSSICEQMAFIGTLSPLVGAWAPTVLFGALGIVLFDMVRT